LFDGRKDGSMPAMSDRELIVVAGALARSLKPKVAPAQDALAKRWRTPAGGVSAQPGDIKDVISLLDGWVKVLERGVRTDSGQLPR
jgi:hypothetical protein